MPKPLLLVLAAGLLGLGFGLGYGLGPHRADPPPSAPTRAISGVPVPAGLASELHAALSDPDLLTRATRVAQLLAPLGPEALEPVQAAYRATLLDTGDVELVLMLEWWARFDPEAAFAYARESRIGWHPAVLTAVVRSWARQDPEAASRAVKRSVQDDRLYTAAIVGLVRGWDESGRDGLEEQLTELAAGGDSSGRAVEAFARLQMARGTPEIAIEWADSLPHDDPQQAFFHLNTLGRVAEVIAESDPQRAAEWAERTRGDSVALMLLIRVGASWAQQDGAAAMRWLGALSPNRDIPTAVQETFRTWYMRDPVAAGEWIRSAELAPWLDPAVATYALHLALEQPDEALAWARRVGDTRRREQIQVKMGSLWLMQRPDDGRAVLERADFSDAVRERIEAAQAKNAKRRRNAAPAAQPSPASEPEPPLAPEPAAASAG